MTIHGHRADFIHMYILWLFFYIKIFFLQHLRSLKSDILSA